MDFLNGKKKKRIKFKDLMNISVVIGQCVIILTGIFAVTLFHAIKCRSDDIQKYNFYSC